MEKLHFNSIIENSANKLWSSHFGVPEAIAAVFLSEGSQRVVCTLNETHQYQCALLPFGEGRRVITINKATLKKLRLDVGASINVALEKDNSEYGLPMPEEMAELLAQDTEGNDYFQALTDGKKRTLLYLIAKPKSSDRRITAAISIVEHLKFNKGKIDFKTLKI
jgi:hypothetical protein